MPVNPSQILKFIHLHQPFIYLLSQDKSYNIQRSLISEEIFIVGVYFTKT
jgi:hypothetical protein